MSFCSACVPGAFSSAPVRTRLPPPYRSQLATAMTVGGATTGKATTRRRRRKKKKEKEEEEEQEEEEEEEEEHEQEQAHDVLVFGWCIIADDVLTLEPSA